MEDFIEKEEYIYRFCDVQEVLDYIRTGYIAPIHYEFVSLTNASLSVAMRRFGDEKHKFVMVFNRRALLRQGLTKIEYNYNFLSQNDYIFEHIINNVTNEDYDDEESVYGTAGYPEVQKMWYDLETNPDDVDTREMFDDFMKDEFSCEKEYVITFIKGIKGVLENIIINPLYLDEPDAITGLQQIVSEMLKLKK